MDQWKPVNGLGEQIQSEDVDFADGSSRSISANTRRFQINWAYTWTDMDGIAAVTHSSSCTQRFIFGTDHVFFFLSPRVETTFNYLFMSCEKDDCANKMDKWETPNQLSNCIKSAGKRQKPVLCLLINLECIHGIYKLYKKLEKSKIVMQFYFIHTTMLFYKKFIRLFYRFDIEQVRLLSQFLSQITIHPTKFLPFFFNFLKIFTSILCWHFNEPAILVGHFQILSQKFFGCYLPRWRPQCLWMLPSSCTCSPSKWNLVRWLFTIFTLSSKVWLSGWYICTTNSWNYNIIFVKCFNWL